MKNKDNNNCEDHEYKTMYMMKCKIDMKDMLLNKPSYELSNRQ